MEQVYRSSDRRSKHTLAAGVWALQVNHNRSDVEKHWEVQTYRRTDARPLLYVAAKAASVLVYVYRRQCAAVVL